MKTITKWLLFAIIFLALGFTALFVGLSLHNSTGYAWRIISMLQSDPGDIDRFPKREISNGNAVFPLPGGEGAFPEQVTFSYKGEQRTEKLQELILRTGSAAFIVIQDDRVIMQVYHDSEYATPHTSFSVAKSFDSALIGAAISDGYIGSVDDRVIEYIPELAGRGFDALTIRNLLKMDTGIRYISADERPFFMEPFSDDALTYYPPDLREVALGVQASEMGIGEDFHYNNFHPLLEGLILERATGMPVAKYMQQRLWIPMGAEFPASWSLDSEDSGFEKMESGINAAPIDFARFGLLYLHDGFFNGKQILPAEWVEASTRPDPADQRPFEEYKSWTEQGGYYGFHWWGMLNEDGTYDYAARGHLGQIIYVSPSRNMVVVRFGAEKDSAVLWFEVIHSLLENME